MRGKPKAAVDVWERAFKRAFVAAGMPSGHAHQLRDTFAVGLLQQGIPLEEVSKLLGHTSIKTDGEELRAVGDSPSRKTQRSGGRNVGETEPMR